MLARPGMKALPLGEPKPAPLSSASGGVDQCLLTRPRRQRRLTPAEVEDLREVYDDLVRAHRQRVLAQLLRRGVPQEAAWDLVQEVFLFFFRLVTETGFPDCIP